MPVSSSRISGWNHTIEIAWLIYFRIAFGALMFIEVMRHLIQGRVRARYIEESFHFKYFGFDWVRPWPGYGMYLHYGLLAVLALAMASGCFYRVAATLFWLGITYIFLLDQSHYLNHYYLICLLSFIMIFLPAHRAFSLDARRNPALHSSDVPAWTLWLLRGQLGIVYVYAGIAKINDDWLRGEPMRTWLERKSDDLVMGSLLTQEWVVYLMSYAGMLIDLLVVPFLLYRKTRIFAFAAAVLFHLVNMLLFSIGIFPWLMIAATMIFFPPDWPLGIPWFRRCLEKVPFTPRDPPATRQRFLLASLGIYMSIQVLLPLRHFLYPGNAAWTEEGHRFAWRMLLRTKDGWARFMVTDPKSGKSIVIDPREYLTEDKIEKMSCVPDMILQLSHYLAEDFRRQGYTDIEVRARVKVSLNGRPHQLLVDPDVNLASRHRSLWPAPWILPLPEFTDSDTTGLRTRLLPER